MEGKQSSGWTDCTTFLKQICDDMAVGQLIHGEGFSMFDAMSALEIMDPKMDAGVYTGGYQNPEEVIASGHAPLNLTGPQLILVMDELVAKEAAWHRGHSLAQSVFTCVYMLRPAYASGNRVLAAYCAAVRALCAIIRSAVSRAAFREEEDFITQTFGFPLNEPSPPNDSATAEGVSSLISLAAGRAATTSPSPSSPPEAASLPGGPGGAAAASSAPGQAPPSCHPQIAAALQVLEGMLAAGGGASSAHMGMCTTNGGQRGTASVGGDKGRMQPEARTTGLADGHVAAPGENGSGQDGHGHGHEAAVRMPGRCDREQCGAVGSSGHATAQATREGSDGRDGGGALPPPPDLGYQGFDKDVIRAVIARLKFRQAVLGVFQQLDHLAGAGPYGRKPIESSHRRIQAALDSLAECRATIHLSGPASSSRGSNGAQGAAMPGPGEGQGGSTRPAETKGKEGGSAVVPLPPVIGFDDNMNRKRLGSTPPRPVVHISHAEAYDHFQEVLSGLQRMLAAAERTLECPTLACLLTSMSEFAKGGLGPVVAAQLKHCMLPDGKVWGDVPLLVMVYESLGIPSLKATGCPPVVAFVSRATKLLKARLVTLCANLARQHRQLLGSLRDWGTLANEAAILDESATVRAFLLESAATLGPCMQVVRTKGGGQPESFSPFSDWVLVQACLVMRHALLLALQLQLYSLAELPMVYWYLEYLLASIIHVDAAALEKTMAALSQLAGAAQQGADKKKSKGPRHALNPAAAKAHALLQRSYDALDARLRLLDVQRALSRGLLRLLKALYFAGRLPEVQRPFNTEEEVFIQRFSQLTYIPNPAPLSYAQYVQANSPGDFTVSKHSG
eukprot:jgi/Mesvir1/14465/Mv05175-RA.3